MLLIVSKVLVVFIYVIIGFATYRIGVFNDDSIKHITAFVVKICCPALTISTVAGAELKPSLIGDTVFMLVGIFAVFFVLTLLALWISRRMRGIDKFDANVYALGMTTTNSGFMGFPVTQSVFGPMAFYFMVIANISLNISMYSVGIWQLNFGSGKKGERRRLKEALAPFCNIIILSAVFSLICLFSGVRIPAYVMNICDTIGQATIPTSMILVGIQLGSSNLASVAKDKTILFTTFVNLVVFPAILFGIALLLPVPNLLKLVFALSGCFPCAAIGVAISAAEGRNSQLYAELVAASTLLSMITLPIWIVIIGTAFPF